MKHHNARFLEALAHELLASGFSGQFIIKMLLDYIDQKSLDMIVNQQLANSKEKTKFYEVLEKVKVDFV